MPNMQHSIRRLEAAGLWLYGYGWQSKLARELQVDARTIRRYYAGDAAIPHIFMLAVECLQHRKRTLEKQGG